MSEIIKRTGSIFAAAEKEMSFKRGDLVSLRAPKTKEDATRLMEMFSVYRKEMDPGQRIFTSGISGEIEHFSRNEQTRDKLKRLISYKYVFVHDPEKVNFSYLLIFTNSEELAKNAYDENGDINYDVLDKHRYTTQWAEHFFVMSPHSVERSPTAKGPFCSCGSDEMKYVYIGVGGGAEKVATCPSCGLEI